MGTALDEQLSMRFASAEAAGSCLVPLDETERRALLRRKRASGNGGEVNGGTGGGKGRILSPHPGLFARETWWNGLNPLERHIALLRGLHCVHPNWVFAAFSAAALLGLDVSYDLLENVCIAVKPGSYTKDEGSLRRIVVRTGRTIKVEGMLVTHPLQTLLDCACLADFPNVLAILDSGLRDLKMYDESIKIYVQMNGHGRKGIAKARLAVKHMSGKSANGGESKARAVMIEEGFMLPEQQVELTDPVEPWRTFIVDFLWRLPDGTLVAGEHDGREKMENPEMLNGKTTAEAFRDERERESHLTARGLRVLRFTPEQVRRREEFVRLLEAFEIPRVRKPIAWR